MNALFSERDHINFGDLPEDIDALLQEGVAAYWRDPSQADRIFRQALAAAPTQLPVYFCLYKIHTYQGNLDDALSVAESGLHQAAAQAGWDRDWRKWQPEPSLSEGAGRFALYTLKALAFIHLRKNDLQQARELLDALRQLDPAGAVGWPVVAALADGIDDDGARTMAAASSRNDRAVASSATDRNQDEMFRQDDQPAPPAQPVAAASEPAAPVQQMPLTDKIIAALRTVHDPEIPVNIYDLGLIYRIEPGDAGLVEIDMTLTAPGCPVAVEMLGWVQKAVSEVAGIDKVDVRLVFDPPWDSSRMTDDVKLELGLL